MLTSSRHDPAEKDREGSGAPEAQEELQLRRARQEEHRQASEGDEDPALGGIPEHPEFPDIDDAVEAHDVAVQDAGQPYAHLHSPEHLESALGRAENHWYYSDPSLTPQQRLMQSAAMMGHGVAQAQAFEDGNKRTAYWLMHGLLSHYGMNHVLGTQTPGNIEEDDPEMATIVRGWGEHTHEPQHLVDLWDQRHQGQQGTFSHTANILDPIHNGLDPLVFDDPEAPKPKLKHEHAVWIGMSIMRVLEDAGYRDSKKWLTIVLTGSLTTYQYSDESDCDVSLFVDSEQFPDWSRAEMIGLMVNNMDGTTLPGTPHVMQCFVVAPNIKMDDLYKPGLRSGLIVWGKNQGQWIVPPERDRVHDVEHEENQAYTIALENADKMERLLRYEPDKAVLLWHQIHKRRQRDQRAGKGDFAPSNITYKFLANRGLFPALSEASGEYIA